MNMRTSVQIPAPLEKTVSIYVTPALGVETGKLPRTKPIQTGRGSASRADLQRLLFLTWQLLEVEGGLVAPKPLS